MCENKDFYDKSYLKFRETINEWINTPSFVPTSEYESKTEVKFIDGKINISIKMTPKNKK